ncbi:MAG TPA: zinc ribbon domain-containing protein [Pyrinomonadaceae bacterium]|jgi:hypothetical protein|nr:zinc ribbon domain-containing protein [Pyrinomonadaceae bacterium]
MYCASCGKAVKKGVTYCTRCGARADGGTEHAASKLSESSFITLVAGLMGIPIAGLGVVIGLMSVMKEMGFSKELIIVFMSLGFLLLLAAEAVFIWLLVQNRARADKEKGSSAGLKGVETKELGAAQVRALSEPMPSVTEGATRPFEAIPHESKLS